MNSPTITPIINNDSFTISTFQKNSPSEGEILITRKLKKLKIRFDPQVKIQNLKDDSKAYREADFYLNEYGTYLEFFGQWNESKEHRERYKEKKNIYFKNHIPVVYIYPENIGAFNDHFDYRLQKELEKHKKEKELKKYHFYKIKKASGIWSNLFLLFIVIGILILSLHKESLDTHEAIAIFVLSCISIFPIYRIYHIYKRIKNNDYPLDNLD